ncbi:ABC transporter ATP-binding protein [Catenulispora pinisilvae]|uniref:ABC transporter ATP-binding protein n=1 Tax=Catenulispora pinisilvae TaxID=2705253 RepID=UPI001E300D34|nr:ABC transporter ATP-binding protein [Catenulispora pinisilvae]
MSTESLQTAARTQKSILRRGFGLLGVAIRTEPRVFAAAVGGSAVYGLMTVGAAWAVGWATDHAVLPAFKAGKVPVGATVTAGLLILGVALAKVMGIIGRRLLAGVMQFRLQSRYRRAVSERYLQLPLSWHRRHPTGQLLSNAGSDVDMTWQFIAPLPMSLGVLIMMVAALVSMVLTDPVLAIVGFLLFPAIIVLNTVYQRFAAPRLAAAQEMRAGVAEIAHESFDGGLVVKTLGREDVETARFAVAADQLRDANIAAGRARAFFDPALEAVPNFGVLVALLVGTSRVASGAIQAGQVVQVAYLITLLAFPLRAIGWVLGELPRSVVGYARVKAVLDARGDMDYGTARAPAAGAADVRLEHVDFGYAGQDILRDVDLSLRPGSTVALVGPTGAGKSTLTGLLARLSDPDSGSVRLDGTDVREFARGQIPAQVSLVPQQTFLFADSIRDNIRLDRDADDEQVWAALRLAQADRFVKRLPEGLDSVIGERGATLSGGQRQRLALARALIRQPRLLILDDCTASVDPQVEAAILGGLRAAAGEGTLASTVLVVAYRKATIALADEVVYVERGRIIDHGPHLELVERCEGYRDLITAYERDHDERDSALQEVGI